MRLVLFVLAVVVFVAGFVLLAVAKGSVQEMQAFVLYEIAAILFTGAAIVDAIIALPKRWAEERAPSGKRAVPVDAAASHA